MTYSASVIPSLVASRRVPESRYRRDHLVPASSPSVQIPAVPDSAPSGISSSTESSVPLSAAESAATALSLLSSAPSAQSTQLPLVTQRLLSSFQARSSWSAAKSKNSTPSPTRRSSRAASRDASAIGRIQLDNLEASYYDVLGSAGGEAQVVDAAKPTPQSNSATSTAELSPSEDSSDLEANIPLSSRRTRPLSDVQKSKLFHDLFQSSDESEAEKDDPPASLITQSSSPPSPPSVPLSTPIANPATPPSTSAGVLSSGVSPVPTTVAKAKRPRPPSPRASVKKPRKGVKSSAVSSKSTGSSVGRSGVVVPAKKSAAKKTTVRKAVVAPKSTKKGKSAKSPSQLSSASSSAVNFNSAGSTTVTGQLPDLLTLPIAQLRRRAAQAASRDSRVSPQMKMWRSSPFFHSGAQRRWDRILKSCVVLVQMERVDGNNHVRPTPSSLEGVAAFADIFSPQHPCQQLRVKFPKGPFFMSDEVLDRLSRFS
ncbi:hypothetical protein PHYPSEUDO_013662 [Phytophthora pseudosyringae]|uniref:Uncharacterized protein n=1 Tax=Phytophthora pseudosyringae TaxID=221518 RepID=A0A8T1V9Y7_9STRA|nr:hypothetical protein PHYPSEUDO_013662 [Phytophthora pseudosyringae]